MSYRPFITLSLLIVCSTITNAATYYIDPAATTNGNEIFRNDVEKFVVGQNAFADFATFAASNPEAHSTVYVGAGTYSTPATITTPGLTFLGNNAYRDWIVTRANESSITAQINIEANDITINGFKFTGNGRIVSTKGANGSPISGIKFLYNYINGSTISRSNSKQIFQIGSRDLANANNVTSQCRYKDTEVAHNYFEGDATHYPSSIGLNGIFGDTKVYDNKFYDGASSIWIYNAQGNISINNNKFISVGKTSYTQPDGGLKGDFCVALYYSAYANTTTLDIKNNDFDGCYGQQSIFPLIRIHQGEQNESSMVVPKNLQVNINHNIFKNKISLSENSNSMGENYILYNDNGTGAGTIYDLRDNHFDNRFYKFAWVELNDGLNRREVYANAFDEFRFGGEYSTMGSGKHYVTSSSDNTAVDISNHQKGVELGAVTVLQSMDIDMHTGDMYFLQLMGNSAAKTFCEKHGLSVDNCDPLVLTKVTCTKKATKSKTNGKFTYSTTIQTMNLAKSGHGVKLEILHDPNDPENPWLITGAKGSDNGTGNDLSGTAISKFKFVNGTDLITDGRANSATQLSYHNHPAAYSNAYAAVDEMNRYICISSSVSSTRQYHIYDLDEFFSGISNPRLIKVVTLNNGDDPINASTLATSKGSVDAGFCTWSYQSFAINGDYLYLLEGESEDANPAISPKNPVVVINIYNWRTNQFVRRTSLDTYARINDTFGEPEAISIRPDCFGNVSCYLGIAVGASGSRTVNVFKLHVDRHVDDSGAVYGIDPNTGTSHSNTSQYSGVKMTVTGIAGPTGENVGSGFFSSSGTEIPAGTPLNSGDKIHFQGWDIDHAPALSINISRSSEYLYGSWVGTITGEDGNMFDLTVDKNDHFTDNFTATIKYKGYGTTKTNYNANLRLSSPGADDIIIPITANVYNLPTGIEYTTRNDKDSPVEWYNFQGVRIDSKSLIPGIYIRRQGNDVKKVFVK